MRKLFIGTTLTSLLGALVVGGVLAWTGSTTNAGYSTLSGTVCATISSDAYTGNQVFDGAGATDVLQGGFTNCTSSPGVNLSLYDANPGDVTITSPGGCALSGDVVMLADQLVGPGGASAPNRWSAQITMGPGAPNSCQTTPIVYDVTINVET